MQNILELKPNIIIGDNYEGQITLTAWKGFQSRQGFYGSKDSNETSNGLVKVFINGWQVDYVKTTTQEQINSILFLQDNSEKIRDEILNALYKELPEIRDIYEDLVPEINSISDLKNFIGLSIIHIMESDKDGFAYIGYELGCDWDDEHGIGVMTHKDRVIEIGQADTSFNSWITYKDNGTEAEQEARWNEENRAVIEQHKNETKKPWWKSW
ncbi:MAG: hypothetical protein IKD55_13505 [Sediminibacterium sp.]|nr:hypothetical protein [Sediminibacterium sp.]